MPDSDDNSYNENGTKKNMPKFPENIPPGTETGESSSSQTKPVTGGIESSDKPANNDHNRLSHKVEKPKKFHYL